MPSTTPKQKILNQIMEWMSFIICLNPINKIFILLYLVDLYERTARSRYVERGRMVNQRRTCSMEVDALRMLELPERDFYREFRITQETFMFVLQKIKDDDVFFRKPVGRPQTDPMIQLAIVIWRMTHEGNGALCAVIGRTFGTSEGSVVKFTDRVLTALIAIESRYTHWPKRAERERIAEEFDEEGIPGGCVGAIDGCHMVLYARPGLEDHKDFFNRKDRYSYNIQAVAGFDKRIRHLHIGHPGSSHDMRVFAASQIGEDPEELFRPGEFLIADGGYQALDNVVPVFREDQILVNDQVRFNKRISHARVRVEHAFGILKGRFSSLRGLRVGHTEKADQERAMIWIRCCVILHNLIREEDLEEDDALWLQEVFEEDNEDDERPPYRPATAPATSRLARDHP